MNWNYAPMHWSAWTFLKDHSLFMQTGQCRMETWMIHVMVAAGVLRCWIKTNTCTSVAVLRGLVYWCICPIYFVSHLPGALYQFQYGGIINFSLYSLFVGWCCRVLLAMYATTNHWAFDSTPNYPSWLTQVNQWRWKLIFGDRTQCEALSATGPIPQWNSAGWLPVVFESMHRDNEWQLLWWAVWSERYGMRRMVWEVSGERLLGRKYLEWTMRRKRDGKWVRQHIPKEEKQYSIIPVHLFSGGDKQWRKVEMWFFWTSHLLDCVF